MKKILYPFGQVAGLVFVLVAIFFGAIAAGFFFAGNWLSGGEYVWK